MLALVVAGAGGDEQCRWKQTGGCSPSGRREPRQDRRCSALVPAGASGYCVCPDGQRAAAVGCDHKSFRCRDMCKDQPPASSSSRGASSSSAEGADAPAADRQPPQEAEAEANAKSAEECRWRQTGACSYRGRREPRQDKACNALVGSGQSGWCDCGGGRVAARVGCGHSPFRCAKRCKKGGMLPSVAEQDEMARQERQGGALGGRGGRRRGKRRKNRDKEAKKKGASKGAKRRRRPSNETMLDASGEGTLRAVARDGRVAVSHTNAGNLPFARNWFASLQRVGVPNWALFATDDEAHAALREEVPAHVVRWQNHVASGSHFAFRSKGWTRVVFAVPRMARMVLGLGLAVLWIDTDIVALANPFPVLDAQLAAGARPAHVLAQVDGRVPDAAPRECARAYSSDAKAWGASAGTWKLCSGLFLLRPANASLAFLDSWAARLAAKSAGGKNQPHFNEAMQQTAALTSAVLPCDLFPNGFRYASAAWRKAQARPPVMVHNNWIVGARAKRKRFVEWGLWRPRLNAVEQEAAERAAAPTPQAWAAARAATERREAGEAAEAAAAAAQRAQAAAAAARAGLAAKQAAAAKAAEEAVAAAEAEARRAQEAARAARAGLAAQAAAAAKRLEDEVAAAELGAQRALAAANATRLAAAAKSAAADKAEADKAAADQAMAAAEKAAAEKAAAERAEQAARAKADAEKAAVERAEQAAREAEQKAVEQKAAAERAAAAAEAARAAAKLAQKNGLSARPEAQNASTPARNASSGGGRVLQSVESLQSPKP